MCALYLCEFAGSRLVRLGPPQEWDAQTLAFLDLLWGEECDVVWDNEPWGKVYLAQAWETGIGCEIDPLASDAQPLLGRRIQSSRRLAYADAYLTVSAIVQERRRVAHIAGTGAQGETEPAAARPDHEPL